MQQLATADVPAIVRATALEDLARHPSREAVGAAQRGLADADPLVRLAALRTLRFLPVEQSWKLAYGLLDDPVRGVRLEAASLLAAMPQDQLAPADRERLARATGEYVAAQRLNADRPEARVNLGNLYAQQGDSRAAEAEYLAARALIRSSCRPMSCSPNSTPGRAAMPMARGSCAKRSRACPPMPSCTWRLASPGTTGSSRRRVARLRTCIRDRPAQREIRVRPWRRAKLRRPDRRALAVLEASQARHPADRDTLLALVTINRDAGRFASALSWANRLVTLDPQARTLRDEIARLAGGQQ